MVLGVFLASKVAYARYTGSVGDIENESISFVTKLVRWAFRIFWLYDLYAIGEACIRFTNPDKSHGAREHFARVIYATAGLAGATGIWQFIQSSFSGSGGI
jgi:hypothetical protein